MQKIQKIFAGFLVVALLLPSVANADLDPVFRKKFQPWVEELCHASIEYTLDDRVWDLKNSETDAVVEEGKFTEYHRMMNCLLNAAMADSTQKIKKQVEDRNKKKLDQLEVFEMSGKIIAECENLGSKNDEKKDDSGGGEDNYLDLLIEAQRHDGFQPDSQTRCRGEGVRIDEPYSVCRVEEVALRELCAYQQFLLAKSKDFQSFRGEERSEHFERTQLLQLFGEHSARVLEEIGHAEDTLSVMFVWYKIFVQRYRQHAWLTALIDQVGRARRRLIDLKNAVETFPAQFCNAAKEG